MNKYSSSLNIGFLLCLCLSFWGCDGKSRVSEQPSKTVTVNLTAASSPVHSNEQVHLHADISGEDAIKWIQTSGPSVAISDANTENPLFTTPVVSSRQTLGFELQVRSGAKISKFPLTLDVIPSGLAVNAGNNQIVNEGATVTLHASAQSKQTLTYSWAQISGHAVSLSNANTDNPKFTADIPYQSPSTGSLGSFDGDLVFRITITEAGTGHTTYDEVTVNVQPPVQASGQTALQVKASLDQDVKINTLVHLHGVAQGGTAGAGGYTSYTWTQTNASIAPAASLSNANTANPDFTPMQAGRYVFEVTVTDSNNDTATDSVVIDVKDKLSISFAASSAIPAGQKVSLHPTVTGGSGTFSYQWATDKQVSYVSGSATDANPTVTYNPTASEVVKFTLTVTDNGVTPAASDSTSKTIGFLVPPRVSTVDAGADKTVAPGDSVTLHALATPQDSVSYQWQAPSGITLNHSNLANALFTAPTSEGDYEFSVTASTSANSVSDKVTITVQAPTTSNAGTDQTVTEGDTIHLHGAAAHGSGTYTYLWSVDSSTSASAGGTFDNAAIANPIFSPSKAGVTYTLQLTVTDSGTATPVVDTVDITVRELMTVNAGTDRTVKPGDSVSLHAVADKPGASFAWSENPATGITINNATTDNANITAPAAKQAYGFEVEASKALTTTATDDVTITVQDPVSTNAGTDQTVVKGHLVHLHGSAAHGTGPYTYQWSTIKAPETVTFTGATTDNPSFTPNTAGTYKLDLQVTDSTAGTAQVVHDTATITVAESLTVKAGSDQSVKAGATVHLRPTHSGGVGPLTYSWNINGTTLENGTSDSDKEIDVSYTPVATESKTLTLTVTDTGDGNAKVSDTVDLTFSVAAPASTPASSSPGIPISDPVVAAAIRTACPPGTARGHDPITGIPTAACNPDNHGGTISGVGVKTPCIAPDPPGSRHGTGAGRKLHQGEISKAYHCGTGRPGESPAFICERLGSARPPTACASGEMPYLKLINTHTGARTIEMGCMSLQTCKQDWINDTSDDEHCTTFDKTFVETLDFECTYCCVGDGCNNPQKGTTCLVEPGTLLKVF